MVDFKEKVKEPILTPKMQGVIENSQQLDSKSKSYDQIIRYKHGIMKTLTQNPDVLRTLHNEELEPQITDWDNPNGGIYQYVNIFDFLKIPGVQSTVKNYICFAVAEVELAPYNDDIMVYNVMFRTVSHEDDYKTDWGIARQDLLAAIIKNEFDWTGKFGMHFVKSSDREKVYEDGFYYREFVYEINSPNATQNKLINGGGYYARF